jgi:uncharacterized damage-inducible protein DinB
MINKTRWFDRKFQFDLPLDRFPDVVERLRGTPPRLAERTANLPLEILVRRDGSAWSIQEQVGHLLDLEPLWSTRIDELLAGAHLLSAADLQNRKTHEANHNADAIDNLLKRFKTERDRIVGKLEHLEESDVARSALHPRLAQPMNMLDLAFFVAEHDDHHLARISILRRLWNT